jgi:hypothetical protein
VAIAILSKKDLRGLKGMSPSQEYVSKAIWVREE